MAMAARSTKLAGTSKLVTLLTVFLLTLREAPPSILVSEEPVETALADISKSQASV